MKTIIDSLKEIQAVLECGDLLCETTAISMLSMLIKSEELKLAELESVVLPELWGCGGGGMSKLTKNKNKI